MSDDKEVIDEGLGSLAKGDEAADAAEMAAMQELAARVEEPGLQDQILERYMAFGRDLLADEMPSHLDPRLIQKLSPSWEMSAQSGFTPAQELRPLRAPWRRALSRSATETSS